MNNALELLAPAKNADVGIEAIKHGADAVYIGGPAFGARYGAGNTVADIERLAAYAHRFHAKVFVPLNTILRDDELDDARKLAWQMYEAGADALIVQDMGLLELDLPPIQLHASTQTDIRTPEKARFLQDVGFSQIVLARELSLDEIRKVGAGTTAETPLTLEFFIHGALCVAFSGQCYISHAHTGRSANRGECSQACRLPYTLEDKQGRIVAHEKHLLSMKDNDQSANLRALADAGIRSFKIEGRLKDSAYVKNATAHYRQLIDAILIDAPEYSRASSGHCTYSFTPRPEKTFNRGATDYFVNGRQPDIGAFDTPSFAGEESGTIARIGPDWIEVDSDETFANGDGISYMARGKKLVGMRINIAHGKRLFPNEMPEDLKLGMPVYRNRDQAFERLLEKDSAERRIPVRIKMGETADGFALCLCDDEGTGIAATITLAKEKAKDPQKSFISLGEHLGKLGTTDFKATEIKISFSAPWFLPASAVNALRRDAVEMLIAARETARPRLPRAVPVDPPAVYPERELSYLGNVLNSRAREFYRKHGVELIADAYEADTTPGDVSLMITKHCLRYSYSLCPKEAKGWVKGVNAEPMTLVNGKERLLLRFDCKACEMHVVGKMKKHRRINIVPVPGH
jgi:collagenase-like PrtC family protease